MTAGSHSRKQRQMLISRSAQLPAMRTERGGMKIARIARQMSDFGGVSWVSQVVGDFAKGTYACAHFWGSE